MSGLHLSPPPTLATCSRRSRTRNLSGHRCAHHECGGTHSPCEQRLILTSSGFPTIGRIGLTAAIHRFPIQGLLFPVDCHARAWPFSSKAAPNNPKQQIDCFALLGFAISVQPSVVWPPACVRVRRPLPSNYTGGPTDRRVWSDTDGRDP